MSKRKKILTGVDEINLRILELKYNRYVSRSHTTFEVGASLIPTILLGVAGVFFALQQADRVIFNKYYIIQFSLPTLTFATIIGWVMLYVIFKSHKHRFNIENAIQD